MTKKQLRKFEPHVVVYRYNDDLTDGMAGKFYADFYPFRPSKREIEKYGDDEAKFELMVPLRVCGLMPLLEAIIRMDDALGGEPHFADLMSELVNFSLKLGHSLTQK